MRSLRIAVIDDDASLRAALAGLLRSHGHHVSEHVSAKSFIASSDMDQVDCVVSDIHMPEMSGLELKRRLDLIGSRTPVIMITGRTCPWLQAQVVAAGAYGPLIKPFEAATLLSGIEAAVANRR